MASPNKLSNDSERVIPRIDEGVFGGLDGVHGDSSPEALLKLGEEQGPLYRALLLKANRARQEGQEYGAFGAEVASMVLSGVEAQYRRNKDIQMLPSLTDGEDLSEIGSKSIIDDDTPAGFGPLVA